ncbi:MAG: hypothetical protein KJ949_02870 [Nanoarchaeota archaeon]|nr:hypothetical protein [Nanoarchaeota archaeon]
MIKEFKYYVDNNFVKKGSPDISKANSLIEKAEGRIKFSIKSKEINKDNPSYIFEDIYECLREALQSLMAIKGYKPYSHEAIVSFLKKFHNFKESDVEFFNRYRILRNKSVYGCEKISIEICKNALNFLNMFFPKIKKEFFNLKK